MKDRVEEGIKSEKKRRPKGKYKRIEESKHALRQRSFVLLSAASESARTHMSLNIGVSCRPSRDRPDLSRNRKPQKAVEHGSSKEMLNAGRLGGKTVSWSLATWKCSPCTVCWKQWPGDRFFFFFYIVTHLERDSPLFLAGRNGRIYVSCLDFLLAQKWLGKVSAKENNNILSRKNCSPNCNSPAGPFVTVLRWELASGKLSRAREWPAHGRRRAVLYRKARKSLS